MTKTEGKAFLEDRLTEYQSADDLEKLICYKTGTRKEAAAYQKDVIFTTVDLSKERPEIRYIVKCFIHMELYVAWPKKIGQGNGKYIFYKKDLAAMERETKCTFREVVIKDSAKAYIFRGEEGADKFIKECLGLDLR